MISPAHRILVHGHRGARARYPENSLPGFRYAIDAGADAVEMDVAVTMDNLVVVSHDPHLDGALIHGLTLAEIGQRLPTLDDVLDLARGNRVIFNIEIKSFPDHPDYTPPPAFFSQLVLDTIRRPQLESRGIVQSVDFRVLVEMKKLAPEMRLAALWEGEPRSFVEIAQEAGTAIVAPQYKLVTLDAVQAAHAADLQVIPWTANHPCDWDQLIAAGVDAIITDDPADLLEYLKHRGLH